MTKWYINSKCSDTVSNPYKEQNWEGKEKNTRKVEWIVGMNFPALPFKTPNERKREQRLSPEADKPNNGCLIVLKNIQIKSR